MAFVSLAVRMRPLDSQKLSPEGFLIRVGRLSHIETLMMKGGAGSLSSTSDNKSASLVVCQGGAMVQQFRLIAQSKAEGEEWVAAVIGHVGLLVFHRFHRAGQLEGQFAGGVPVAKDYVQHGGVFGAKAADQAGAGFGDLGDDSRAVEVDGNNRWDFSHDLQQAFFLGALEVQVVVVEPGREALANGLKRCHQAQEGKVGFFGRGHHVGVEGQGVGLIAF